MFNYNADSTLVDTTKTTSTIHPHNRELLINLLPFTEYAKGSEIDVIPTFSRLLSPQMHHFRNRILPVRPRLFRAADEKASVHTDND